MTVNTPETTSFTTTWDYTTLKLFIIIALLSSRFTTTWDYTTLKPNPALIYSGKGFTTTWDYTTLKLMVRSDYY